MHVLKIYLLCGFSAGREYISHIICVVPSELTEKECNDVYNDSWRRGMRYTTIGHTKMWYPILYVLLLFYLLQGTETIVIKWQKHIQAQDDVAASVTIAMDLNKEIMWEVSFLQTRIHTRINQCSFLDDLICLQCLSTLLAILQHANITQYIAFTHIIHSFVT